MRSDLAAWITAAQLAKNIPKADRESGRKGCIAAIASTTNGSGVEWRREVYPRSTFFRSLCSVSSSGSEPEIVFRKEFGGINLLFVGPASTEP